MKAATKRAAEREIRGLLDGNPVTEGMTLRVHGRHLILGREDPDPEGPYPNLGPDERLRLTHLWGARYGLSVRRHTGRWEKTPFSGTLPELVDAICATMQHLVAVW
jgi:hypothetical protein